MSTRFYDTDLTDAARAFVAPVLPTARPGGRPRTTNLRAVLNAIFYLLRTGCQWGHRPLFCTQVLPPCNPAFKTKLALAKIGAVQITSLFCATTTECGLIWSMQCKNCTNSWWEGDETFPLCTTSSCWLADYRQKWLKEDGEKHIFREPATTEVKMNQSVHLADVEKSIHALCQKYAGDTEEYHMKGSKSATTRVKLRNGEEFEFKTTNLMHSEMVAIHWMIENGHWTLMCGTVVWNDGKDITPYQFETMEPHCGFCSFFLNVLNLPLTTPTYGLFKLASRRSYILPPAVETDVNFLARVLDAGRFGGLHKVKQMLNGFVLLEPKSWVLKFENIRGVLIDDTGPAIVKSEQHQITFEAFLEGKREVIYAIWKHINDVLFKEISNLMEEEKNSKEKRRAQPYTTRRRTPIRGLLEKEPPNPALRGLGES